MTEYAPAKTGEYPSHIPQFLKRELKKFLFRFKPCTFSPNIFSQLKRYPFEMNWKTLGFRKPIGPLQDTITWYKIRHTGTQTAHWDIQNKGDLSLSFVLFLPLYFGCPSAQFASEYGGLCTIWSYPAKGLLTNFDVIDRWRKKFEG